jgi:hypothetical protein
MTHNSRDRGVCVCVDSMDMAWPEPMSENGMDRPCSRPTLRGEDKRKEHGDEH